MNYKHIIILLSLVISIQSFGQKKWTLDECISYAIEHNLQLNDFTLTEASNKESYRQSIRNLLPRVNGFADYNISFGRQVNPNDNSIVNTEFFSNNYSISGSFDVFQGFQKLNTIKATKFLYNATKEERLQQKYLLAFRVMRAFYDIQFIEELIEISEEQVAISQTNFDLVTRQIELGLVAGADLYDAEALLLADQLTLTQNQNLLKAAQLSLLQQMNIQNENEITIQTAITESVEELATMKADSVYQTAVEFVPIIKAQENRVKAAKKQLAVARGNLYPSLALQGGYGTGYFETITDSLGVTIPFRTQIRDNTNQFIGASLNVPIFSAWANRSRIKQQKIALDRAKNNAKIQEQELYQLIQQLIQEYNALNTEIKQTERRAKAQELAFNVAQKRYENGLINAIDLGRAKTLYATAQNDFLQARLRLQVNTTTLDFYNNLPVFNIN